MKKIIIIILLIIIGTLLYGKYIEPKRLKINEYKIESDKIPDSFTELKIVHFSDLLYNNDKSVLEKIKNKINELDADIIFFTGDLFHKNFKYTEDDKNDLTNFLKELNASLYKYSITGDNDLEFIENYKDIMYDSDFILLNNENKLLFYKDVTPIRIIGLNSLDDIENTLKNEEEYNYSIAITHYPDYFDKLRENNIDLVLSGHSLGGVINLPFYGGLIKKDNANKYLDNYEENDSKLYVSNGIGYENYEFRLFNIPSINVYRFIKN